MAYTKNFVQTTRGKLIVSFALILCISLISWIITRTAFKEINTVVERLSKPNQKLEALNNLQLNITRSIEFNRLEALQDRIRPSESFEKKSAEIRSQLNDLKNIFSNNPVQVIRLQQVDSIFDKRERLFKKYLEIRYNYIHNNIYDNRFEELARQVEAEAVRVDSNVVTTEKQTKTYTILSPEPEQKTKRKKGKFPQKKTADSLTEGPKVLVEEKLDVKIDTLVVSQKRDSVLENIKTSLSSFETERNQGRQFLRKQELLLIQSNEMLLDRLLGLIHEVEQEERIVIDQNAAASIRISQRTILFTRVLSFVFILAALVLISLIIWDITRMNTYRKELELAKAEAEYHSEAKQRFLSNMSHEIRTPLQTILGFSELLAKEKKYDADKVKVLASSSRHLLQVVNEILDYSRIVSNTFIIEEQEFDLRTLLLEINETADFLCRQKNLQWISELQPIDGNHSWVCSDSFRIKQILLNVIGNAVKYTEQGSIRFSVSTKDQRDRIALKMQVEDTGIGMEETDLDRIFQQFEQARAEQVSSGTGLGLSIVKELLDAMKGTITVKSEPGKGSRFDITLFLPKAPAREEITTVPVAHIPGFTGKIWIVDDDPLILQVAASFLQQQHLSYTSFTNAEALLQAPWDEEVKLIFSDIRLPGISGMELCREIRRNKGNTIRIVALTAQAMPEEKQKLFDAGFDDIVYKPFSSEDLYAQVQQPAKNISAEFDLSLLRTMISDEEEIAQIRLQFISDSKKDLEEIDKYISAKNTGLLPLLVHRLAGRFAQMGSRTFASKLRMIEQGLEKNELADEVAEELKNMLPSLQWAVESI